MKKLTKIFILLMLNTAIFAQTKPEIYNNPNIVWAGIVDIDIVIDADSLTDWKYYEISGLGGFLKQHSKVLKPNEKALNEIIIDEVSNISLYQSDSLKYKYDYNMLDIFYEVENPEYYGYEQKKLPASESDVFRLHSFIYYDKSTLNFHIQPLAVGILRSENDTGIALNYKELGWLPVSEWKKSMHLNEDKFTFAKRFYRDIAFENVRVFKQEWTIEETMENMITEVRKQAATVKIKAAIDLDGGEIMENEAIKTLQMEEVMAINFETFDYEPEYVSILSGADFVGVRLNLDWSWNEVNQSLYIHQTAFSPLIFNTDDGENIRYYERLFLKEID